MTFVPRLKRTVAPGACDKPCDAKVTKRQIESPRNNLWLGDKTAFVAQEQPSSRFGTLLTYARALSASAGALARRQLT